MLKKIIPHITIVLGLMCVTLYIFDRYNGVLALMSNEISKGIILALSVFSVITSILLVVRHWRDDDAAEEAREAAQTLLFNEKEAEDIQIPPRKKK